MKRGFFIVFEGIDGSGKSSCMLALSEILGRDMDIVTTSEPTHGEIGKLIRKGVAGISPQAEALLFVADRAQHTLEIQELLESGKTVLCDRYYASTLAYQSASLDGRSVDLEWLKAMNKTVTIEPDVTFLFDIDPAISLERVEKRGSKSKFELESYLSEVRMNYLAIAEERGFTIIDASAEIQTVIETVLGELNRIVGR